MEGLEGLGIKASMTEVRSRAKRRATGANKPLHPRLSSY